MRLIFVNAEGDARTERSRPYRRLWQFPDGTHWISPNAIYQHDERKLPSIALVWHGVQPSEGTDPATVGDMLEIEILRQHRSPMKVSKYLVRRTFFWLIAFAKFALLIGSLVIVSFVGILLLVIL